MNVQGNHGNVDLSRSGFPCIYFVVRYVLYLPGVGKGRECVVWVYGDVNFVKCMCVRTGVVKVCNVWAIY